MTAEERGGKWIAELEEAETMTPEQLRAEVEKLAQKEGFPGFIAKLALLIGDAVDRLDLIKNPPRQHHIGH